MARPPYRISDAQGGCPLPATPEPNPIIGQNERKLRYELVRDWVLDHIRTEHLGPGERLPTSTEIARSTGISLISVRRALEILEREGRIRRHQGIGTFVARDRIASEPNRPGEIR